MAIAYDFLYGFHSPKTAGNGATRHALFATTIRQTLRAKPSLRPEFLGGNVSFRRKMK